MACETGSQYCSGNVVYGRCRDLSEELAVQDCAALGQVCSEGRCRVPSCEPTSTSCEGNVVVTCAADGLSIAKREPCGANRQCVGGKCERQVCQPGRHCKGTRQVEVCSDDGLTLEGVEDCGAAEGCEEGECRPKVCTENSTFCTGDKRMRCSASGAAEEEWPCAAGQSCQGSGQCVDWECEPNVDFCEGDVPSRCAADGLSSVALGEPCTNRTTCSAGACEVWRCEPGLELCAAGEARVCAADGMSSAPLTNPCDGSDPTCEVDTCDDLPAGYAGYARWPLPGTSDRARSYITDPLAKTVRDNVTGLLWQREVLPIQRTSSAAKTYCEGLTLGGRSDWRLPTRMELISLVDYTQVGPAIDRVTFPSTPTAGHWSGSESAGSGQRWYVEFNTGEAKVAALGASYHVRCVAVAAPQKPIPPSGHFFEVTGDTVLDAATGLEWQRGTSAIRHTKVGAVNYCNALTLDGKSGWRLPATAELSGLVREVGVTTLFIDEGIFPDTQSDYHYWSNTPDISVSLPQPFSWYTHFNGGTTDSDVNNNSRWVRCVR
ncbi:MAG: DUF1566 domain-containing protein [Polyangiaceae bacterium]|nr:DUF1566 domain-containing protein [Polyangiaceae bacterium]